MQAQDGTGQRGHTVPRHVWVRDGEAAAPGVLLDWQEGLGGSWAGLVMFATAGALMTKWAPAEDLRPADAATAQ